MGLDAIIGQPAETEPAADSRNRSIYGGDRYETLGRTARLALRDARGHSFDSHDRVLNQVDPGQRPPKRVEWVILPGDCQHPDSLSPQVQQNSLRDAILAALNLNIFARHSDRVRMASIGRLFTTARSRIAEDALSRAVERGMRQIVILGAELDTFALRNPHGARQIRIYEVDHPATQAWKRQRLAEAQIALPPWLILVPVDFEQDDVGEKLVAAGFQQNSPAFFTWLGVVPYLTQDAIGRTLDYVSSIRNSEEVFDYMEPPETFSEEPRQLETERTEQLKKIGERSVSRFEPAGIAAILRSHGFCAIEDINFQEIASRFGRAVQGLAPGHAGVHVVHAKHLLNAVPRQNRI